MTIVPQPTARCNTSLISTKLPPNAPYCTALQSKKNPLISFLFKIYYYAITAGPVYNKRKCQLMDQFQFPEKWQFKYLLFIDKGYHKDLVMFALLPLV